MSATGIVGSAANTLWGWVSAAYNAVPAAYHSYISGSSPGAAPTLPAGPVRPDILVPGDTLALGNDAPKPLQTALTNALKAHGVGVVPFYYGVWLRDSFHPMKDGKLGFNLVPSEDCAQEIKEAGRLLPPFYNRAEISALGSSVDRSDNVHYDNGTPGCLEAKTLIEGGNILVGERPDGQSVAIIGINSRMSTAGARAEKGLQDFSAVTLDSSCKKRYAGFDRDCDEDGLELFDAVALHEAKRAILEELGMQKKDVIWVPQPEFHIDMAMSVGPQGRVFVADPQQTVIILERLLKACEAALPTVRKHLQKLDRQVERGASANGAKEAIKKLSELWRLVGRDFEVDLAASEGSATKLSKACEAQFKQGIAEIRSSKAIAARTLEDKALVLDDICAKLTKKGLTPIRVPGQVQGPRHYANFLNGFTGKNPDGTYFYITANCALEPLKDAFTAILKKQGIENVEYVGQPEQVAALLRKEGSFRCTTHRLPLIDKEPHSNAV